MVFTPVPFRTFTTWIELTLPPGVRIYSFFTTPRLVPFYMAPQGVSDVIVPLEALPQEVLDCFNQPFLDVGQPPHAFENYEGATPAMLAYDCVPPVEAVSADTPQAIADDDTDGILVLQSVDREKVLIDPLVFRQTCKRLKYKPCAVLFASATHKQQHHYSAAHLTPRPQGRTLCLSTGMLI